MSVSGAAAPRANPSPLPPPTPNPSLFFGANDTETILDLYPKTDYPRGDWWRLTDVAGDWGFTCPARRTARHHVRQPQGTYRYFFTVPNDGQESFANETCIGTCHSKTGGGRERESLGGMEGGGRRLMEPRASSVG